MTKLAASTTNPFLRAIALTGLCALVAIAVPAQVIEISGGDEHADWPSAAFAPNGDLWVAWSAYDGKGSDRILLRRRSGFQWQETLTVTPRSGDYLKTALAIQPDGRVWVVWGAQSDGNFDLYARSWHEGSWTPVSRLTTDSEPDIHHRLVTDSKGRLHLVWQSFRTGDANIYLKKYDGQRWSAALAVTSHEANDWEPAIAVDAQDRLFIVYDTYRHGDYDVYLRILEDGELSREHPIADSPNFEARATVAIDGDGRAWVAWDDQGPNWALDMPGWTRESKRGDWGVPPPWSVEGSVGRLVSLRRSQKIGLAVFAAGQRWTPKGSLEDAMGEEFALSYEIPELAVSPTGVPVLFLRRWVPRADGGSMKERPGAWNVHAMTYVGVTWSAPERLEGSAGSNDQDVAAAIDSDGQIWAAYPSDDRWSPGKPVTDHDDRLMGRIRVAPVPVARGERPALSRIEGPAAIRPYKRTAWTDRRHTVAAGDKRYQLYWGDLHRHTEISGDGGFDGTLWDMYRYAFDAAELDFIASTDHFYGATGGMSDPEDRSYDWWRTQKLADAFLVEERFSPLFGYERSIRWPYGHRNIINLNRGTTAINRTFSRDLESEEHPRQPDELALWDALRGREGFIMHLRYSLGFFGGTEYSVSH